MKPTAIAAAAALALAVAPASGQTTADQPAEQWQVPRTEWGDPDLRGKWPIDYLGQTPRERPAHFGTRAQLTDEEYEAAVRDAQAQLDRYDAEEEAGKMGMGHWAERGLPLRQTSLIVEPADGRYPEPTEEGRKRSETMKSSWSEETFVWVDDFSPFDRCISRGMPSSMLPGAYNGGIEVFQAPGLVAISLEMIHETRLVYLDGRDPPPKDVTSYLGFSVGHWDGDTLVIETTNLTPGLPIGSSANGGRPVPNSDQMRIVEHITPTGPDTMRYEAWIEDPVVLTAPFKLDFPWRRNDDYGMYEYACHEGNVQFRGYITATAPHLAEWREAQWAKAAAEKQPGASRGE